MNKKILNVVKLIILFSLFASISVASASEVTGTISTGVESGVGSMDGIVKAAPTASPAAGTYNSTQSVSLTASGSMAICYTTNGTTPSCATSTTCTTGTAIASGASVSVASTTTIKSAGCYADASTGPVATDAYTLSCATTSVTNGSVAAYPSCAITCNSGYTLSGSTCIASGGGGGGGGGTTTSTIPTSITGVVVATASAGGVVSKTASDGGKAKITLPANALSSSATITITPTAKAGTGSFALISGERSIVGDYVYNFTAVSGTTAVTNFNKAVTVTLTYTDAQIAGLSEGTLKIYYWDNTSSEWVALANSTVNTTTNTVTATTTHFTYFAVLGELVAETEVMDGDIIQAKTSSNPFAVYIVKLVGNTKYIRHIVSLDIFNYYSHLKWENLKQVDSLSPYSLSGWVRVNTGPNGTPGPNDKVYEINGDQTKHWINMTAEQFLLHGGSDTAIYTINQGELNLYTIGPDVMML